MPFVHDLISSLTASPSTFHCVSKVRSSLLEAGFTELSSTSGSWNLVSGGKYFTTRNQSTLCAWIVGEHFSPQSGSFSLVASHSDSPTLKVRPKSDVQNKSAGVKQLDLGTYGGGLWQTFQDRKLSLAGKVVAKNEDGSMYTRLVTIPEPIMFLPSLAIHLRKGKTEGNGFDLDKDTNPVLCLKQEGEKKDEKEDDTENKSLEAFNIASSDLLSALGKVANIDPNSIVFVDLESYDTEPPAIVGLKEEFLLAQGLDNKASVFASLEALLTVNDLSFDGIKGIVVFDHEEIGSGTDRGASSNFLPFLLSKIFSELKGKDSEFFPFLSRSIIISADGAHATHPSYPDKTDGQHHVTIGKGVAIKHSNKYKYVTDLDALALANSVASSRNIPLQFFCGKESVPGGSTVGPHLGKMSITKVLDLGIGMWGMHSVRESCSVADLESLYELIKGIFEDGHGKSFLVEEGW
ncbi:hypothetical protein P9112_000977 [Eukaryota sp. TZLM1-RC]